MVDTFVVPSIDYTSRDFLSIRDDLINLIPFYTSEWTDHNPSDLGIVLIELFSGIADSLHFYVDRMQGESNLETAITRSAIVNQLKLLSFIPPKAVPAGGEVVFTVPSSVTGSIAVFIPAATQVATAAEGGVDEVIFETTIDAVIPVGTTSINVPITQGQSKGGVPPLGISLGTSSGEQFQKVTLSETPVILNSVRVFVDEGGVGNYIEYAQIASIATADATARVFSFDSSDSVNTTILFGDGENGKIPPSGATMQTTYRTGGGIKGTVGAGTITNILSSLAFSAAVTNPTATQDGSDEPSLAEVKALGSKSLATRFDRVVLEDDFISFALSIAGVSVASASFNEITKFMTVYIADTLGQASVSLKSSVKGAIEKVMLPGVQLVIGTTREVPININANIVVNDGVSRSKVLAEALSLVDVYFEVGVVDGKSNFGTDVRLSDILSALDTIDGVNYVDLDKLTREVTENIDGWTASTSYTATDGSTVELIKASPGLSNNFQQDITIELPDSIPKKPNTGDIIKAKVSGSLTGPEDELIEIKYAEPDGTGLSEPYALVKADINIQLSLPPTEVINAGNALPATGGNTLILTVGAIKDSQIIADLELRTKGLINLNVTGGSS